MDLRQPEPARPARVIRATVGRIAYRRREALAMTTMLSPPARSRVLVLTLLDEREPA